MRKSLKVLRVLGIAKLKTFSKFMGVMMLFIPSSYSIASDFGSTCWVYGGLLFGQNAQMVYGLNELESESWPDTSSAFQALEDFTASRLLGAPCGFIFPTTISRIEKGGVRTSWFTSGPVGDPRTGIVIGYRQTFAGFNQSGDYCSVYVELEILDGTYLGRPQCRQNYTVKLSPLSGAAESGTILTSVEPSNTTGSLVAKVYDNNGQMVPNVKVKLDLSVDADSGGHHQHGSERPKGSLRSGIITSETISGSTGTNGFVFTFKAPAPAGDHKIKASCTDGKNCKPEGPDTVWVGIKDLIDLPSLDVYALLPNDNDPKHPDNHYMTYTAMLRVTALAALYHGQFPDDPLLHLNDASLERGGIFDFKYEGRSIWWTPPHFEHCRGTEIDIRANLSDGAIPESNFSEFDRIAKRVGADPVRECKADENKQCIVSTRHYHVRLTGGKPKCP